ncbi:hypothetical protein DDZ16_09485 [Marinilabilia rubra]|uniref:Uncharacterized protein n=1 Tax=Marinilabilia rubra TaxID=2162893 RepID=A0A2U2B9D5_9BACT|nr:hypothetical protein DDZ16_09485 [Marinilabilia rubra]
MSSAGHIIDMINRAKQNEALKRNRRERTQRVLKAYRNEIRSYKNNKGCHEEISEVDLLRIKESIRKTIEKERRHQIFQTVVLLMSILGCLIYLVIKFLPVFKSLWF